MADVTVVVTRPKAQATDLAAALEGHGARVLRIPTIRIDPPADPAPLAAAVRGVVPYDWVVFTSTNGVLAFCAAAEHAGLRPRSAVRGASICCVGPATARAAEAAGLRVELVPQAHVAEGALSAIAATGSVEGVRFLLPVAEGARDVLPRGLRELGAEVEVVTTHRTVPAAEPAPEVRAELETGVDLVTFTSPSSVRGFDRLHEGPPIAPAAVIGPVTAAAAREAGYEVPIEADEFTVDGLVGAVVTHYTGGVS